MKLHIKYAMMAAAMAVAVIGCDNTDYSEKSPFDNTAYLNVAATSEVENVIFKKTIDEVERELSGVIAYPAGQDIEVSVTVEPSLVSRYNAKYGTDLQMLASGHYEFSSTKMEIPAGSTVSEPVTIRFYDLEKLEIDVAYLVPVTIGNVSGGVGILKGASTLYYVVKRSSAITVAANIKDNYLRVPGFYEGGNGGVVNNMPSVTYEALINVSDFNYAGPGNTSKEISTIMGVEQHFLMRIGDASFPVRQLQVQGPLGKFPEADNSKLLLSNEWYHVALTWDIPAGVLTFYVNGQVQSRSTSWGSAAINDISLADPEVTTREFYIGYSFEDDKRQLCGDIAEARVWSVARTQQQIWESMYEVDPLTPGLVAYWKFNEGQGDTVYDHTPNGNHAVANSPLSWPNGIEIPQLNLED